MKNLLKSNEIAIHIEELSKAFQMYKQPSDRLKQLLWGGKRKFYREFWAVRGVDLDILRGETVGIVGRNGSGKSTLLQMICGTLQPTCGNVTVQGRIAALLELGSGFNPEFTGRENVFLNGAILGLSRAEVEARYDEIAAFADIGDFIDQPVKSYSSGMYVRLAFAVAISVNPDVLVVDEALSVGDQAFQRKCFARLDAIRKQGCTILFVSHSAGRIVELCNRAVLMDRGECILTGDPKRIVSEYQKLIFAPSDKQESIRNGILQNGRSDRPIPSTQGVGEKETSPAALFETVQANETDAETDDLAAKTLTDNLEFDPNLLPSSTVHYSPNGAEILNARILNDHNQPANLLQQGNRYTYAYEVIFRQHAANVRCGMLIKTISGVELGGRVTHPQGKGVEKVERGTVLQVRFPFQANLTPGAYFLNAGVSGYTEEQQGVLHRILDAVMFKIEPSPERTITSYVDFSGGDTVSITTVEGELEGADRKAPPAIVCDENLL